MVVVGLDLSLYMAGCLHHQCTSRADPGTQILFLVDINQTNPHIDGKKRKNESQYRFEGLSEW